jgi:uncharacterized damage-inducible protein DinB
MPPGVGLMGESYFLSLARYNAWANRRLYDACTALSEAEYMKPRPAFFGSIHGTLNHLLVGDHIWIARLERKPNPKITLDQVLYGDLVALRIARQAEDDRLINVVRAIAERSLDQPLAYANTAGKRYQTPLRMVLGHLFNHQTHHRGQAHALLTACGQDTGDTDLFLVVPEAA